jgi:hypothetical protein
MMVSPPRTFWPFCDVYIYIILHEDFDAGTKLDHAVQLAVLQFIPQRHPGYDPPGQYAGNERHEDIRALVFNAQGIPFVLIAYAFFIGRAEAAARILLELDDSRKRRAVDMGIEDRQEYDDFPAFLIEIEILRMFPLPIRPCRRPATRGPAHRRGYDGVADCGRNRQNTVPVLPAVRLYRGLRKCQASTASRAGTR